MKKEKHEVIIKIKAPKGIPYKQIKKVLDVMLEIGYADACSTTDNEEFCSPYAALATNMSFKIKD